MNTKVKSRQCLQDVRWLKNHFTLRYELFKTLEDGIYKVLISSGEEVRDGIMYFWTVERLMGSRAFRGLVCLTDDTEGIEDAKKKFEERREWL